MHGRLLEGKRGAGVGAVGLTSVSALPLYLHIGHICLTRYFTRSALIVHIRMTASCSSEGIRGPSVTIHHVYAIGMLR